jgi:hypothetical protein
MDTIESYCKAKKEFGANQINVPAKKDKLVLEAMSRVVCCFF